MIKKILLMTALALSFQFVNAQAIDDSQILLYLDFEGDVVDAKGNFTFTQNTVSSNAGAVGSPMNDPVDFPVGLSGLTFNSGKYARFRKSSIRSTNSVYNSSASHSISVWVRATSRVSTERFILDIGNNGGGTNDGQVPMRFRNNNSLSSSESGGLNDTNNRTVINNWYHFAVVMDATAGTQKLYINGFLDKSDTSIAPRNVMNDIIIGSQKFQAANTNFWGHMDDLVISSEVWTQDQVRAVMNLGVEAARSAATTYVWNGSTDNTWGESTNWTPNGVPSSSNDVIIPSGAIVNGGAISVRNMIIQENASLNITGAVTANSTIVYSGASFITTGAVSGSLTYNVITNDPIGAPLEWHLLSSPVSGETYDDTWVSENFIGTGTANNRAIAIFDNTTDADGDWIYHQKNTTATFDLGIGISARKTSVNSAGEEEQYSFTGTYPNTDVTLSITDPANDWNLIGNPYPAYMQVSDLMSTFNKASIPDTHETVYVWNPTTEIYTSLSAPDYISPGQGFFVISENSTANNFVIETSMRSDVPTTPITFYKNKIPKINLTVSDGNRTRTSEITYSSNSSLGLDPGKDIGLFTGQPSDFNIYTHLVADDKGIAFEKQMLPNSEFEKMIVPIGITSKVGKQLVISAESQNLPSGINVYLEDRVKNTYTKLEGTSETYSLTLDNNLDGVGRFFIHTSPSETLSAKNDLLNSINVFKTSNSSLRISGLKGGTSSITLYNILGKEVAKKAFKERGNKEIMLPNLATGIYIVKLETEYGNLNKKIVLE